MTTRSRLIRTTRVALPTGLVVERVQATSGEVAEFVSDLAGCEVTQSTEQSAELDAALGELPR